MSTSGKKAATGKQAAAPKGSAPKSKSTTKGVSKSTHIPKKKLPVFESNPRKFGIGQSILPKRDLSRFVRWPKYIRLQRQKAILLKRLKVPGTINQFSRAADRNTAAAVISFLEKYRPETSKQKAARLKAIAETDVKATKGEKVEKPKAVKPKVVKYGLNHVTSLVESKKALLVIIAHDVDPLELVLWLPTLCKKKDVPYMIIKGKSRLGKIVHKKTAAALAITSVHDADKKALENLVTKARDNFNSRYSELVRQTGGQIMGSKHLAARAKEEKARVAAGVPK